MHEVESLNLYETRFFLFNFQNVFNHQGKSFIMKIETNSTKCQIKIDEKERNWPRSLRSSKSAPGFRQSCWVWLRGSSWLPEKTNFFIFNFLLWFVRCAAWNRLFPASRNTSRASRIWKLETKLNFQAYFEIFGKLHKIKISVSQPWPWSQE